MCKRKTGWMDGRPGKLSTRRTSEYNIYMLVYGAAGPAGSSHSRAQAPISYGFRGQIISPFYGPLKYKSSSKLNSSHPHPPSPLPTQPPHFGLTCMCARTEFPANYIYITSILYHYSYNIFMVIIIYMYTLELSKDKVLKVRYMHSFVIKSAWNIIFELLPKVKISSVYYNFRCSIP